MATRLLVGLFALNVIAYVAMMGLLSFDYVNVGPSWFTTSIYQSLTQDLGDLSNRMVAANRPGATSHANPQATLDTHTIVMAKDFIDRQYEKSEQLGRVMNILLPVLTGLLITNVIGIVVVLTLARQRSGTSQDTTAPS